MEIDERHFLVIPNTFPSKLWHLVNSPEVCSVCWDTSGEGILIYEEPFEAEVLFSPNRQISKYFTMTDFTSFLRQLNMYGFKKLRLDKGTSENQFNKAFIKAQEHHFQNPNFKRSNPELLVNLKRRTPANRAKLAHGIALSSQASRYFHYPMQKNVLVNDQGTPYHHQHVKNDHRTPNPPQAFLMDHGDPGSMFHHFLLDSPCAHPSSFMAMHQGFQSAIPAGTLGTIMPYYSPNGCCTPVYQCSSPCFLNTNMSCSQQPAAFYAAHGYYPVRAEKPFQFMYRSDKIGYPVNYIQCMDQNPQWQTVGAQGLMERGMSSNTSLKMEDETQTAAHSDLPNNENSPGKTIKVETVILV